MAPPRIYLSVPAGVPSDGLASLLPELTARLDPAALELADPPDRRVLALAQELGVAVLLRDRPEMAAALGADGVVLSDPATYRAARQALGRERIVGVWTGRSRHDAMVAAEAGADFVGLAPDPDLVAWWAEVMEVPCVAAATDPEAARALAGAGADFLALGGTAWVAEDPVAALTALAQAAEG